MFTQKPLIFAHALIRSAPAPLHRHTRPEMGKGAGEGSGGGKEAREEGAREARAGRRESPRAHDLLAYRAISRLFSRISHARSGQHTPMGAALPARISKGEGEARGARAALAPRYCAAASPPTRLAVLPPILAAVENEMQSPGKRTRKTLGRTIVQRAKLLVELFLHFTDFLLAPLLGFFDLVLDVLWTSVKPEPPAKFRLVTAMCMPGKTTSKARRSRSVQASR